MMLRMRFLIFLVAFAIILQNTCPHGWAGKTAFAASHVSHCSMKDPHRPAKTNDWDDVKKELSSNAKQTFVFSVGTSDNTFRLLAPIGCTVSVKTDNVKDVFSEPLLRPPAFC
jgi:hypothetical protein